MGKNDLHSGHRDRMFKKFSENGIDCFEEHEKLEILLFFILPRVNTNELAHILINRFGSLHGVINASDSDLMEINGLGSSSVLKLHYLRDFFNYFNQEKPDLIVLDSVEKAADYCRSIFSFKVEEEMVALFLDKNNVLISRYNVRGFGPNNVQIDLGEFSRRVVESNCGGVIIAHSHIYTPLLPSDSDFITTRKIANMLKAIGVDLLDHIIVNDWGDYSFRSSVELRDIWT